MFYYTDVDSQGPENFMARIAPIEPEQATPEVKEIYEQKTEGQAGQRAEGVGAPPGDAQEFPRILRQRGPVA